ncbi:MAG: hypothetical protein PHF76_02990 [Bacteroidales bacterium]|nr:hypothetical protein [Bacteroidales bacterium]MDD3913613.1 hypothetical protein [Bacteroidales bacterium]
MMKKFLSLIIICIAFTSCDVLTQIQQTIALKNCNFALDKVKSVSVAGIDVSKNTQLTIANIATLTNALLNKKLPFSTTVQMAVENPGDLQARMGSFDWICAIDGQDIVNGTINTVYTIAAKSETNVPLSINVDIFEIFSNQGIEAIKTFATSLSAPEDFLSHIGIRIKPSITVGSTQLQYPDYITLKLKN